MVYKIPCSPSAYPYVISELHPSFYKLIAESRPRSPIHLFLVMVPNQIDAIPIGSMYGRFAYI